MSDGQTGRLITATLNGVGVEVLSRWVARGPDISNATAAGRVGLLRHNSQRSTTAEISKAVLFTAIFRTPQRHASARKAHSRKGTFLRAIRLGT